MMNGWLWALTGGGLFIILLLVVKIHMLRKAAREIERAVAGTAGPASPIPAWR